MRILYLSHYALPHLGGIEVAVDALAREMLARGHQVTHLASNVSGIGVPRPGGPRVVRVRASNMPEKRLGVPLPVFAPGLRRAVEAEVAVADVIHAHGFLYPPSAVGLRIARRRGLPVRVLTEHVGHVPYESRALDAVERAAIATAGRRAARAARAIVVLNEKVDAEMARLAPGVRRLTIRNGVDTERYRPAEPGERELIRSELGWDERPRVLFVGRLVAKKGLDAALGATREAWGAFELVIVGRGEPPLAPGPDVRFLGELAPERVAQLYRAADLLVLPSRGEGFPLAIQEAMASGLPVIVADDPSYGRYLDGAGAATRRVEPAPAPIAAAIIELLDDPVALDRAGVKARRHAISEFSWARAADEHERLYAELRAPA